MIFDSFLFFNEYDLLPVRLNEYDRIVDKFILIESTWTHQGKHKGAGNWIEMPEVQPFRDRIIQVVIDQRISTNPWACQAEARNRALDHVGRGDLLLYSDADEIVRAEALAKNLNVPPRCAHVFSLTDFYYTLDWKIPIQVVWERPTLARVEDIHTVEGLRSGRDDLRRIPILDAGWHFSCLGSANDVAEKLKAFTHAELNTPEVLEAERLAACVRDGVDLLIPPRFKCEPVEVDSSYPTYVVNNLDLFQHLLREK